MPAPPETATRIIFLGTEDNQVIAEAQKWISSYRQRQPLQSGLRLVYTDLFDRDSQFAKLGPTRTRANVQYNLTHDPLEYLSMLWNLQQSVQCQGWVGTLASNWCRVVDELRASVGGKADCPFADLSRETCRAPPCIGGRDIKTLVWR